ncbi:hypothetical protein JCM6882_008693 [Rhodosporidiobolus microsporus]
MADTDTFKAGKWTPDEVKSLRTAWLAGMRRTKQGLGGKGRRPKGFWTGVYDEAKINRSEGAVRSKARKMEDDLRVDAMCELKGLDPGRPWLDDDEDKRILAVKEKTWEEKGEQHAERDWKSVWETLGRTRYLNAIKLRWRTLLIVQEEKALQRSKVEDPRDIEEDLPAPPAPKRRARSPSWGAYDPFNKRVKGEPDSEEEDESPGPSSMPPPATPRRRNPARTSAKGGTSTSQPEPAAAAAAAPAAGPSSAAFLPVAGPSSAAFLPAAFPSAFPAASSSSAYAASATYAPSPSPYVKQLAATPAGLWSSASSAGSLTPWAAVSAVSQQQQPPPPPASLDFPPITSSLSTNPASASPAEPSSSASLASADKGKGKERAAPSAASAPYFDYAEEFVEPTEEVPAWSLGRFCKAYGLEHMQDGLEKLGLTLDSASSMYELESIPSDEWREVGFASAWRGKVGHALRKYAKARREMWKIVQG